MDTLLQFEASLFDEDAEFISLPISNVDFWVDRLVVFPSLRPFMLEKAVDLCCDYCQNANFRDILIEKSITGCPVLLYRLFKRGSFTLDQIESKLCHPETYISSFYFRKEIKGFVEFFEAHSQLYDYDNNFFKGENDIELMIQYGFVPLSIEYCLKYDDIDVFRSLFSKEYFSNKPICDWSPFEWCQSPDNVSLMSFSGYFGSLQCFKFLLMNGFKIEDSVKSTVVCSGNTDLIRLCNEGTRDYSNHLNKAAEFIRSKFIHYFIEMGAFINGSSKEYNNPLQLAAKNGNLTIVRNLIDQGANVNVKNSNIGLSFNAGLPFIGHLLMDTIK